MTFGKILAAGLMTAALVFTAGSAQATPLVAGGSSASIDSVASLFSGDSLLATMGGAFSNKYESGTYQAQVYRNLSGTLDFVYTFAVTGGTHAVNTLTMSEFGGFTTDLYYVTDANVAPAGGSRSADGNVVKFTYNTTGVAQGKTADTLVIRTNAVTYKDGDFSLQDGATSDVCAYAPASVPEPMTLGLMGFGLIATSVFGRRFAKR